MEMLEQHMQRQREEEQRLQERMQQQQQELEWRQKFYVSKALLEKESGLRGLPINITDGVRQLTTDEFRCYQYIIDQGQKVGRAARVLEVIKDRMNELQPLAEGYLHLSQVLLSCERTKWAYLLDRFFNRSRHLSEMVEFCVGELEGVEGICQMLETATTSTGNGEASSRADNFPSTSCMCDRHSAGSLANCAEYYTRKRDNFSIAWEAQLEAQGEGSV